MSTLVECVPNFSEGRDKAKVDAIVAAMKMDGVYLLDREMDTDHNRCVITLVGEREPIQEAAIRGVGKAAELIDLTKHLVGLDPYIFTKYIAYPWVVLQQLAQGMDYQWHSELGAMLASCGLYAAVMFGAGLVIFAREDLNH